MNQGDQKGTVVKHWLGVSGTGTMFVGIMFQVGDNESIPGYVYITDKNMINAGRAMASIGWDLDKGDLQELDDKPMLLAGRSTDIDIQEEEYKGKRSLKVVQIGPRNSKPSADQIKSANAKLKAVSPKISEDIPF